jgi:hypothetical protein
MPIQHAIVDWNGVACTGLDDGELWDKAGVELLDSSLWAGRLPTLTKRAFGMYMFFMMRRDQLCHPDEVNYGHTRGEIEKRIISNATQAEIDRAVGNAAGGKQVQSMMNDCLLGNVNAFVTAPGRNGTMGVVTTGYVDWPVRMFGASGKPEIRPAFITGNPLSVGPNGRPNGISNMAVAKTEPYMQGLLAAAHMNPNLTLYIGDERCDQPMFDCVSHRVLYRSGSTDRNYPRDFEQRYGRSGMVFDCTDHTRNMQRFINFMHIR